MFVSGFILLASEDDQRSGAENRLCFCIKTQMP